MNFKLAPYVPDAANGDTTVPDEQNLLASLDKPFLKTSGNLNFVKNKFVALLLLAPSFGYNLI